MLERIVLDASVVVKWFKKGEDYEREALRLFEDALSGKRALICSEWTLLEVARGLRKAGLAPPKIVESYKLLRDLAGLGFVELVPVFEVIDLAGMLIVELNLYASDAVHLATAAKRSAPLVTEDEHLHRREVIDLARKLGVEVVRLRDLRES